MATIYRGLLRELRRALTPPRKINKDISAHLRAIAEKPDAPLVDLENALLFIRSQREHKRLLERYNPTFDLTSRERIRATARRVGLEMPVTVLRRLLMTSLTTQVLKCDPLTITFPLSSDYPQFTSDDTRVILKMAANRLVHLKETVVFPTETVYGLGTLALDPVAAAKIFSTKGRPPDNPLIVHISSFTMLRSLLPSEYVIPKSYQILMRRFWPGPLTLLFPRNIDLIPPIITAGQPTVAIRMPSHPVARALIAVANVPLAAPSANTSGKPSPTRAEHVHRDLDGKVGLILDGGACGIGLESTVVDGLHSDGNIRVLRPGGVTVEDMQKALLGENISSRVLVHKRDFADENIEIAPTTPGMKYRHYSPSVPVTLMLTLSDSSDTAKPTQKLIDYINSLRRPEREIFKVGVLAAGDSKIWREIKPLENVEWKAFQLGPLAEPSVIAHRLFDGLLNLEKEGVHQILIEEVDEEREGLAIMNRVRKAASECIRIIID